MSRRCAPKSPPTLPAPRRRASASSTARHTTARGEQSRSSVVPATTAPRWGCPAVSRRSTATGQPHSNRRPRGTARAASASGRRPIAAERRRAARSSQAASETDSRRAASPRAGRASVPGRATRRDARETGARSAVRARTSSRAEAGPRRATAHPGAAALAARMNAPGKVVAEGRSRREPVPAAKARRPAGARAGRRENREAGDRAVALIVLALARGDPHARRRDPAVVRPCGAVGLLRGDRHPQHPQVAGAEMGVCAARRLYRGRGAFLYVLGCREPLAGTHEQYTSARWRQTLGSTMHCVAGDGVGVLVGGVVSSLLGLTGLKEVALEDVLGFGFGWTIFQALFMRDAAGGSYAVAQAHLHPRASVDESPHGRDGPDRHDA